jgi:dihydroorotase
VIVIEGARRADGSLAKIEISSPCSLTLDGSGLTLLPAGIDPHVHFRTPGAEYKENWISGGPAAFAGGITTLLDMPNTNPPTLSAERLIEKRAIIESQLQEVGLPVRFGLYLGADCDHLDEIPRAKGLACGLKIYMGNSTGNLVMEEKWALDRAFKLAASIDMVVAVHAEDESRLRERAQRYATSSSPETHSLVRDPEAARIAVAEAIELAAKHGARLYIAHVSTQAELEQIRQGRQSGVEVYAEATPHHLFLDLKSYQSLGSRALMNPPLRAVEDREALWEALLDGTIDTVGSDHAPHTLEEKMRPYREAPSGIPGVEHLIPLLLTKVAEGKLSLERAIQLTSGRAKEIFGLESDDQILVDLEQKRPVEHLLSRCGWSAYMGWKLSGWPAYVIASGRLFKVNQQSVREIK